MDSVLLGMAATQTQACTHDIAAVLKLTEHPLSSQPAIRVRRWRCVDAPSAPGLLPISGPGRPVAGIVFADCFDLNLYFLLRIIVTFLARSRQ